MEIGGAVTGGTATRVLYVDTGPVLADSANLTFDGTNLNVNGGYISVGTQLIQAGSAYRITNTLGLKLSTNAPLVGWTGTTESNDALDTGMSRIAAGIVGVGTGAAASVAGTIAATNYRVASTAVILGTAPTLASGGCTTPSAVTANGTARFSIGVGTSCSGSQPLVFTMPAATTSWAVSCRNVTNGATSAPAQTGALSTTAATITNFARTTGLAVAWTDSDVVECKSLGG